MIVAWAWLLPTHTYRGQHRGVWYRPPGILRRVFRRGDGPLHLASVAAQVWGWLAISSGLVAYVLPLDATLEFALVLGANLLGIALTAATLLAIAVMDRHSQ
jgi:hypothetical protein